jgi:hypothetical protein
MDARDAGEAFEAKKAAKSASDRQFVQLIRDYQEVFGSKSGERVLEDLMFQAEFMEMTPAIALQHPHMLSYADGKRNLYIQIVKMLREDPSLHEERIKAGELAKEEEENV